MGQCNQRLFLFTVCSLQLISTIERQVFDLLGYQWLPIAANFLHIVFVIIGFFGGYQYRKSYLITYSVWQFLWLAWNAFIICFYLDVGTLDKNSDILNIGTGAASWWEVNGIGCRPLFGVNSTFGAVGIHPADLLRPPRPDLVEGCLLNYYFVEVIHAAVQLILAVIGLLSFILIMRNFPPEEEIYAPKPRSRAPSLYSVQYTSTRGRSSPLDDELELNVNQLSSNAAANDPCHPPMTPRRVKRRSGSRSSGRHSKSSHRSRTYTNGLVNEGYSGTMSASTGTLNGSATGTINRTRESQRKKRYVNPVNRLMDDSSTSNDSVQPLPAYFPSSNPNGFPPPPVSRPPAILPSVQQQQQQQMYHQQQQYPQSGAHSNPLYQSSRPNSVYSISATVDLDYRPPSAHSSYSNWHGQRPTMPLPSNGHHNLHGHSPTPSDTTVTNTFGTVPPAPQVASGYTRSAANYNDRGMNNYH